MSSNNLQSIDSNKIRFAGDVNVEYVWVQSLVNGKKMNVSNQLITIQIFEDLFSPFITGTLIFRESLDFASNFPFVGEEIIELKIFTPTLDSKDPEGAVIKGTFYVYKMGDKEQIAERSSVYQLYFISKEAIVDINTKTSKGYQGKIHDIAAQHIKDLGEDKKVNILPADNKLKYVSNFWSPVKNLMFLADHGISEKSPSYIFFENRNGFNFTTLTKLYDGNVKQNFIYDNSSDIVKPGGGSVKNFEEDYKRITELSSDVKFNYMDKVSSGAFSSTMLFVDITTKKYHNLKYSIFSDDVKRLNSYPPTSQQILSTPRSVMFRDNIQVEMFTDFGDVSTATIKQARVARLKQSTYFKIKIVVAGRTDYTVGQKVTVTKWKDAPAKKEDSETDLTDYIVSGNYLISGINHVIDREKHECHMELVKDSLTVGL